MFVFIIIKSYICTNSKLKMKDLASDSAVTFKRQKHSIVWKHFKRKKGTQFVHTVVNFCYYGGTSNLHTHLKNAYPSACL